MRNKKRLLVGIMSLIMTVFCAVSLTGCSHDECSHEWGEWSTVYAPNCTIVGYTMRTCEKCGEIEKFYLEKTGHISEEDDGDCTTPICCAVCGDVLTPGKAHSGDIVWVRHVDRHYQKYTCCEAKASEPEAHTFVNGVCTVCGYGPKLSATTVEANRGESVVIAFSISDNPGVTGLTVSLQYSSDVMHLAKAESGEAFTDLYFTASDSLNSGCKFLWDGVEVKDEDIKDGEFLVLTFDISANAPAGQYDVVITVVSAYDSDLNPITLNLVVGQIEIKNG